MAYEYLEAQRIKIVKFTKMLECLCINDFNHFSQLQAKFNSLYDLPKIVDKINIYKKNPNFVNQCRITQSLLNKKIFEIRNKISWNSDFNYLYSHNEEEWETEIYIYDIKHQAMTSTSNFRNYEPNRSSCCWIVNYIKFSNSHLLIIGANDHKFKGFIMELKTKIISEMFTIRRKKQPKNYWFNEVIYYNNDLYIFGELSDSGLMKYNINRKKGQKLVFPRTTRAIYSVLFHDYVLISFYLNSSCYLYDLLIEDYSEITFHEGGENRRFLFTDQVRVYLLKQDGSIYESGVNNPFKWNIIGKIDFGFRNWPSRMNFSNFEGNIYFSFFMKPYINCYKFNRERKAMELIYQEKINS